MLEDLKSRNIEYVLVEEFLKNLKIEFRGGDNESAKIAELKKDRIEEKNNGRIYLGI